MQFIKNLLLFLIIYSLPAGCTSDEQTYRSAFSITNCEKLDKEIGSFAKIKLTAHNNSSLTMGCWAYIKIKKNNTIIETSSVVYSSLKPGESQIEEAWFSKFSKHSAYDKAEVTLQWNIDSTNYSKEYVY